MSAALYGYNGEVEVDVEVHSGAEVGENGASHDDAPPADMTSRIERLQSITDSALGYLSLEEMLSELLGRIRTALGVDTAALLLLDDERGVLVARAARGLEEEVRQGVQVPLARGFAGRIAAQGRPIVIEDLDHADVFNPILRQKGIRSMLGVPVQVDGHVIGVMHIGTLTRRVFGEEDIALMQHAADRAALAIDTARLSEQRAVTEMMQRTLLPEALPQLPGIRLSAKYLPAGSGIKVGGDWYDVFQLSSGRLTFVIGDVVGRGVIAASVMAEARTALRAYLMERHELSKVMSLLNDLLVSMGRSRSATAALLALDPELGELEAVSAGHLPALLVGPDGSGRFLEHHPGLPLGIKARQRYVTERYPFALGSALLLYTDGLVERRGEPIDKGLARLRAAAEAAAGDGEGSLADGVYRRLLDDTLLDDDVALLAVESLPLGPKLELTLDANPAVLTSLRRVVGRWLASRGAGEDELFDITLSVSEAAANAIEHAYGARPGTFDLRCECEDNQVRVTVEDEGRWRAARPIMRGRGLLLMRSLMDSVEVQRGAGGTVVRMTKRLAKGA